MTTNVRDSLDGELATDSRWSFDGNRLGKPCIGFIDDTGFEKIIHVAGDLYMFAGNAKTIADWKDAIYLAAKNPAAVDWDSLKVNGMAISSVVVSTGRVKYELGHEITLVNKHTNVAEASFAGTGSYTACGCWQTHRSSRKAVDTAKATDPYTGGTVRYFNFRTGSNNLQEETKISSLAEEFLKRGTIMYASTKPLVPVAEAAANDKDLAEMLEKIKAGEIQAAAPCDAVYNVWPEAERKKLVEAMRKTFPTK